MKAMVLKEICGLEVNRTPLELTELPEPVPAEEEILVKVSACGVCHTELDEIEGRTPPRHLPVVLGHQVVGRVAATGNNANTFRIGERVGIAWIYAACGACKFCLAGNENLCRDFKATGRDANGGYAQYMTVSEGFASRIPDGFNDTEAAPTGLRDGRNLGLIGFGASGHLVLKMARYQYPNAKIFVFARNVKERAFSRELGAVWAGDIAEEPLEKLDCIIDTTPAWGPVVEALKKLEPGGRLVINAIGKEGGDKTSLLSLDYPAHLWLEKEIKSVANVSRRDVSEFLVLAAEMRIKPEIQEFALEEANAALIELRTRGIRGAKVLKID
jgi:alcohol dehydrogenase, propanol-preferring